MNSFFKFKKFIIYQDKCAQKVSEIACLLGATCPLAPSVQSILDIGAGTGLLSLMLAQKSNAKIDSIEIDNEAYWQLTQNVLNSTYANQIHCIHADVNTFKFHNQYDLIICNPPFFSQSLLSSNKSKNRAWHDETLSLDELFSLSKKLLNQNAILHIVLPFQKIDKIKKNPLSIHYRVVVAHSSSKPPRFEILGLSHQEPKAIQYSTLYIKENSNYTQETITLLKDYYLNL